MGQGVTRIDCGFEGVQEMGGKWGKSGVSERLPWHRVCGEDGGMGYSFLCLRHRGDGAPQVPKFVRARETGQKTVLEKDS